MAPRKQKTVAATKLVQKSPSTEQGSMAPRKQKAVAATKAVQKSPSTEQDGDGDGVNSVDGDRDDSVDGDGNSANSVPVSFGFDVLPAVRGGVIQNETTTPATPPATATATATAPHPPPAPPPAAATTADITPTNEFHEFHERLASAVAANATAVAANTEAVNKLTKAITKAMTTPQTQTQTQSKPAAELNSLLNSYLPSVVASPEHHDVKKREEEEKKMAHEAERKGKEEAHNAALKAIDTNILALIDSKEKMENSGVLEEFMITANEIIQKAQENRLVVVEEYEAYTQGTTGKWVCMKANNNCYLRSLLHYGY